MNNASLLSGDKNTILISCPPHITPYLQQEITALGLEVLSEGFTTVETMGTFEDAMRLNIHLRTANHVYFRVAKFSASTMEELYQKVKDISWENILLDDGYFSVHSVADHPQVENTMFLNLKVKDAIADRFQQVMNKRPDSGSAKDRAVIFVFWKENEASIYIDTSGEPLTKHGYRKISMMAPLQESLGAAMIMSTRWNTTLPFVNPMCGSGTLAIEAALMACNKAPGLMRSNFGFMHVKGYEPAHFNTLIKEAREKIISNVGVSIIAGDISPDALRAAKTNAENAGVAHLIEFIQSDFENTPMPGEPGVVIFNPPYGERLGAADQLEETYASIGNFLKKNCRGYWGYILTANPELAKKVGLKAKRKIDFFNGQLKCKLLEYELYEGSKKRKNGDEDSVLN